MFSFRFSPLWFSCLWFLLCGVVSADVPLLIEYSGRVSSGGSPFTGMGSFKFAFVDSAGTTTYWSNDGTSTGGSEPTAAVSADCDDGFYSVYLGDSSVSNMTVIAETVFDNDTLYLRVWFDDGVNGSQLLSPDQLIASTVFAVRAGKADKVANGAITEAMLSAELQNLLNTTTSSTAPSGMATIPEGEKRWPVVNLSWQQAHDYCVTLQASFGSVNNRLPRGWAFQLPTEAQWEFACKAGTLTEYSFGDEINSDLANISSRKKRNSSLVDIGSYNPNP